MLVAAHHKLKNLMLIIDKNGFQAMGTTDEVLALGNLSEKIISFGFETLEVDGHDEVAIDTSIRQLWSMESNRPKALVANTVKGKGVPFMESDNRWHYTKINDQTYQDAIETLSIDGGIK